MFKKTMINFLMIQVTMILMSMSLGNQWGQFISNGIPVAMGFFFMILLIYSLIPSLLVAVSFAYIQKRSHEKR